MGKSTCGQLLQELGVPVHESDHAVHDLLSHDKDTQADILNAFPALSAPIDRKALGALIFGDDDKRKTLEGILHPKVQEAQARFIARHKDKGAPCAALDIPLLFETGADKRVDYTVVVSAPPDIQAQRVLARPGMTQEKFAAILARQMPDADKRQRADFVVSTAVSLADTKQALQDILNQILPS